MVWLVKLLSVQGFWYKQSHLVNPVVKFCGQFMSMIPACTQGNEQDAKEDVANVGENMVEVCQWTKRMSTPEVVEA